MKIAHALEDAGIQRGGRNDCHLQEDFDAIAAMAKEIKNSEVSCFSRARLDDMELAVKSGVKRAVMEITAQDPIIKGIWGSRGKAAEEITKLVKFGKANGLKVTYFLMESSRASIDLLRDIIIPVAEEGKPDNIALVDTRGSAYPPAFGWLVAQVKKWVEVPIEIHCHNNWGFATATTLAGVTAGAEVVHTYVNGMGGNAPLDEIIMGLEAFLRVNTGVKTQGFHQLSAMVKDFSHAEGTRPPWGL